MEDSQLISHKEFFERYGEYVIRLSPHDQSENIRFFTVEQLYQMFKNKLKNEMIGIIPKTPYIIEEKNDE